MIIKKLFSVILIILIINKYYLFVKNCKLFYVEMSIEEDVIIIFLLLITF
jgi:hypothetical protein